MWLTTRRLGPAVVVAVCLVLGACGGNDDEGSGDGGVVDSGGGGDGGGDGDGGGGDGGGGDEVGSPPTAGPGEAGVFTGPSGAESPPTFVIYGCGDIDSVTRLEKL